MNTRDLIQYMKELVPCGTLGSLEVKLTTVSEFEAMRSRFSSGTLGYCPPGDYLTLFVNGDLQMSVVETEIATNFFVMHYAFGFVLIGGLGLGTILVPLLAKDEVASITVVEINQDVIDYVTPHLKKIDPLGKLTVIQGDIDTWLPDPNSRFHSIYIDVWPTANADSVRQGRLTRRYKKYLSDGVDKHGNKAWMSNWLKETKGFARR